jgi:hypothetical protein
VEEDREKKDEKGQAENWLNKMKYKKSQVSLCRGCHMLTSNVVLAQSSGFLQRRMKECSATTLGISRIWS